MKVPLALKRLMDDEPINLDFGSSSIALDGEINGKAFTEMKNNE